MSYQHCRWYDVYPRLAFVLRLVRLMPQEKQVLLGQRLHEYLAHRSPSQPGPQAAAVQSNRWYDDVPGLTDSLERLKASPPPVKEQSADYLLHLVETFKSSTWCA